MEDFVIHYGADTAQAIRKIRALQKVNEKMASSLGSNFQRATNIISTSLDKVSQTTKLKKIKGGFKEVTTEVFKAGTVIKTADGRYKNFVRTLTVVNGKLARTRGALTDVTNKINRQNEAQRRASKGSKTFAQNLSFLAKRAITVIPIWLALRFAMTSLLRVIRESIKFMIDWEYQMAQIAIVGNASKQELDSVSSSLLSLSTSLGISNKLLGEGAKLYIQQGRAMKEIIPLMTATGKLSLLTGRTITQSVEDMTAILKAYRLEASDAINVVDSITNTMLNHAITAGDLASAYKQVASTASALGVSFTALTGFIVAIKAETRDAGGKIGLSLRTMFTRIATTSAEALQSLTQVPFYLSKTGKVTKEITPNMRNLENIIFEIAGAFDTLTNAQQAQVAKLVGGVRRANQVFALFNNFTEAIDAQSDSLFGLGKADDAIAKLTDTTKLRVTQLTGAWGEFIDAVADTGVFKDTLDFLKNQVLGLTILLNPSKVLAIEIGKRFDEQVEALSRQKSLVNSILTSVSRAKSLEEILSRGGGNIELIEKQITSLVEGINKAGKNFGININADISDPKAFRESIESQFDKLEKLTIQTEISIPVNETTKEIASFGNILKEQLLTKKFGLAKYFGTKELKKELSSIEGIIQNISLGSLVEDKDIEKLKKIIQAVVPKDNQLGLNTILDKISEKQVKINQLLNGQGDITRKLVEEEQQKISLIETEFQLNHALNQIKLEGTRTGEFEIDILKKQLTILDAQKDSLSDELFKKRVSTEQKIAKLYYTQGQNIKKAIIANQIIQLKNSKALESSILKVRESLFTQFGIRQKIETQLSNQLKIREQINQESKKENELLIKSKLEILKLQGATSIQLIEQRRALEKAYGIDKNRLDAIKSELDLQKEITKEKEGQNKISSESINIFKIAQKYGRPTAQRAIDFLRGDISVRNVRGQLGEALNEFFSSVVESRKVFDYFNKGAGVNLQIREKGIDLPPVRPSREILYDAERQTYVTGEPKQAPEIQTALANLQLPKIETNIDNVKIELKSALKREDLSEQILNDLASALVDNPTIKEAIENIIEGY